MDSDSLFMRWREWYEAELDRTRESRTAVERELDAFVAGAVVARYLEDPANLDEPQWHKETR